LLRRGEKEDVAIWVKQMVHPDGKPSVTTLRVERRFEREEGKFALVEVRTETGRMHQIRVHCAHVGHPIVGDKIYGSDETCYLEFMESGWSERMEKILYLRRQALHACSMDVEWEGERRVWEAPLPADIEGFLKGGA